MTMTSSFTVFSVIYLAAVGAAQKCTSLTVPVDVDVLADRISLSEPANQAELTAFFINLATPSIDYPSTIINGTHNVKSTYHIAGKLCTPTHIPANGTLEFATHGYDGFWPYESQPSNA